MGPVQFRWPRGVAEYSFTKLGFGNISVDFSQEKQQNTEFTKFSSVRTPKIGSEQKRPGANWPPEFAPESPLQKGVFGSHIFSKEL